MVSRFREYSDIVSGNLPLQKEVFLPRTRPVPPLRSGTRSGVSGPVPTLRPRTQGYQLGDHRWGSERIFQRSDLHSPTVHTVRPTQYTPCRKSASSSTGKHPVPRERLTPKTGSKTVDRRWLMTPRSQSSQNSLLVLSTETVGSFCV